MIWPLRSKLIVVKCIVWQGIVSINEKPQQMIVQGVHELYEIEETSINWTSENERINRFVFIGNRLKVSFLFLVFSI